MGKKTQMINLKPLVFKGSNDVIQAIGRTMPGLQVTKVIQTFVLENNLLHMNIGKDGKSIFAGIVKWIGNRTDGTHGTVFCVQKSVKDQSDLRIINPTEDTAQGIGFDPEKGTIRINSKESVKCSVCGKGISIFDEVLACPLCNSKAHSEHLVEWINMRHSCPICKKALTLDSTNHPIPME